MRDGSPAGTSRMAVGNQEDGFPRQSIYTETCACVATAPRNAAKRARTGMSPDGCERTLTELQRK